MPNTKPTKKKTAKKKTGRHHVMFHGSPEPRPIPGELIRLNQIETLITEGEQALQEFRQKMVAVSFGIRVLTLGMKTERVKS